MSRIDRGGSITAERNHVRIVDGETVPGSRLSDRGENTLSVRDAPAWKRVQSVLGKIRLIAVAIPTRDLPEMVFKGQQLVSVVHVGRGYVGLGFAKPVGVFCRGDSPNRRKLGYDALLGA
jgi:hypothetical protein